MLPSYLRRNHKVRKLLMPPPSDYVYINNATCPKRPDRGTQYQITLAGIEAQILHREGVMVKFLRVNDNQHFAPYWVEGGHPRLGYSWEQRLSDKATLDVLHRRLQRDVPGRQYWIIGADGTIVNREALISDSDTVAKTLSMGLMRHGVFALPGKLLKDAPHGLRKLSTDAIVSPK